jgi:hypothetical protein
MKPASTFMMKEATEGFAIAAVALVQSVTGPSERKL